jgi:RimJ/RimL family protein N-acetyltransferase
MLEVLNDADFLRYVGDRGVRSVDEARVYIVNGPIASYDRFGFGLCAVVLKARDVPIGICGLLKRESFEDVELGFAFLPEYRSKGYALESAAAVMEYARRDLGLTRIAAITSPDNDRSARLLGRIGFRFDGVVTLTPGAPDVRLFVSEV